MLATGPAVTSKVRITRAVLATGPSGNARVRITGVRAAVGTAAPAAPSAKVRISRLLLVTSSPVTNNYAYYKWDGTQLSRCYLAYWDGANIQLL